MTGLSNAGGVEVTRPAKTFEEAEVKLEGGWIGEHRIIGGSFLLKYKLSRKEECEKNDATHRTVFPSCKGAKQHVEDVIIPDKYPLEYFEEADSHVDLIDAGQWNVGLKQTFCSIEQNRLFFNDPYNPLRVDNLAIILPIFNGNVDGGTFAIAELSFDFLETGDVKVEFDCQAYRLNLSEGSWTTVDYLEVICIIFAVELFVRAIFEIRREGFHLGNTVTVRMGKAIASRFTLGNEPF